MTDWLPSLAWLALAAAALYGLHRLGQWLDDRGWLYYRKSTRKGRVGLSILAAFDAEARRILELQEKVQLQEDEDGDPLRPRVRIDRES